jgi:hypothetical protein
MRYIVDRDGKPIDGHQAGNIRAIARSIWAELSARGIAPKTWISDTTLAVTEHYRHEMQTRCEELRLCENGWKADQIAIDYYSSWRKGKNSKGNFNSVKQEIQDTTMDNDNEEDEDNEDNDNSLAGSKRKSSSKESPTPKKTKANDLPDVSSPKTRPTPKLKVNDPFALNTTAPTPPAPPAPLPRPRPVPISPPEPAPPTPTSSAVSVPITPPTSSEPATPTTSLAVSAPLEPSDISTPPTSKPLTIKLTRAFVPPRPITADETSVMSLRTSSSTATTTAIGYSSGV